MVRLEKLEIGEDFRYQNFRKNCGPKYLWFSFKFSFFKDSLLDLHLCLYIYHLYVILKNVPKKIKLLGLGKQILPFFFNYWILVFLIGFLFEAIGDYQLASFKSKNNKNSNSVLNTGLWAYIRYPYV